MKNIREYNHGFLPRRYRTLEDAETDTNAIYPYCYDSGKRRLNLRYEEGRFEEDLFLDLPSGGGVTAERVVRELTEDSPA